MIVRMLFLMLTVAALSQFGAMPAHAQDMGSGSCEPTIASLRMCVACCIDMGHIDDPGVGDSLLAKLDVAQHALDRGSPRVAVLLLTAFTYEVQAQAGKHVDADAASHLLMHAQMVIDKING